MTTSITQYHVDAQSTGANLTETQLTPLNVNAADFGQLYNTPLDGQVYAEPLVVANVTITAGTPGTYASVVYVATQHDSVYAINGATGAILWQRSFLDTTNSNDYLPGATSVTSVPNGDTGSGDITGEIGITSTPVIDASNNVLYVLAKTKETVAGNVFYVQRLHAINIQNGNDAVSSFLIGSTTNGNTNNTPIYVSGTGDGNVNGVVQFNALRENNRPALTLINGQVYAAWASHGDNGPYHGWVVSWNVANLSTNGMAISGVFCTDPNGGEGGIWGGGGGLTFDPSETVNGQPAFYFETGNGDPRGGNPVLDSNGFPVDHSYYESLLKVVADPTTTATNQNSNGWGMKVADYFTPFNVNALDDADEDFGSGSPLVLPDSAGIPGHPHLIVAAGKEGKIYLVDRDNLGKFNGTSDNVLNAVYNPNTGIATPPVLINGSVSTPAYYHGELYWVPAYGGNAWSYVVAPNPSPNPPTVPVAVIQPTSETANSNFGYIPGSVMITANGNEDPNGGIVWIMDCASGEIHAYSSLSLSTELWNSGPGSIATVKFAVPTIANGQVFVGTQNSLEVFGITGASTPVHPPSTPTNLSGEALSGTSVELTWTDPTTSPNYATNYAIEYSTNGGALYTTIGNAGQESTNFTVTGLTPNATYQFLIVSSNSAGTASPTAPVSVTTTSQTGQTPTAPRGLGATPASGSEAYLTWTNTANNETGFLLTRATDSLFTQNVVTETLASAPYYFTDAAPGMSPGNSYYYRLQAINSAGLSSFSNTASANIPNVPPAPTNASAVFSSGQILVSWTDHAGPFALGYQISRSVDGGPYVIYANTPETSDKPPTTQSFTDTNISLGHTYTYEIVAQNVSGFSNPAFASASDLGTATLTLDGSGNLSYLAGPGVPDRLKVQLSGGVYTITDGAVTISVAGAGAGFVSGGGTSSVTIPAANLSSMSLDTADNADSIQILSNAVPITITADSGGGRPTINLGDPTADTTIGGTITNASNGPILIGGSGNTTVTAALICQTNAGVTLVGSGPILISGNVNLGRFANFADNSSGAATVSGQISGVSTTGRFTSQGLVGTYFNLGAAANQIQPASPSNPAWLGNQLPVVTSILVGPIDFPDISDNGFLDNAGDPNYYANGQNVEARWYGTILIPGSGTTPVPINFATTSDDGSMLYIDGNAVVSNNNFQGATQATGLVNLTPGPHTIDIEYYQGNGGASMAAQWDPTGGTNFVDIPNSAFSCTQSVNAVTMNGAGTLTLSTANTYSGSTTINAGTLIAAVNGAMGPASAAGIVVNPGGALALSGNVNYSNAEPLTIGGFGPAGNGAVESLGGVNTLSTPITLGRSATIGVDSGSLTLTATISAGASSLTVVGAGSATFNGNLTFQGGSLNLAGSGAIRLNGNIDLGVQGNLIDSSSGQDTINGVISSTGGTGSLQGLVGTYFNLPAAANQIQPASPSNPAWLGNQLPVVTSTLVGPIDFPDIADNGFLDNAGDPNYYANGQSVEARWYGTILIPGSGTTPVPINFATTSDDGSMLYIDGNAVVSNNNFQGATQATGLVNLTPGLHSIDIEYYQGGGAASMVAQWDPTGGSNFVDIPNSAFGIPEDEVVKTGSGTLTLAKTNTYVGPTIVNAGVLVVSGKILTSAGVTVNATGTLSGNGSAAATTVQSGGVFAPGAPAGVLTLAGLAMSSGSIFQEQLAGTTVGSQYVQSVITAGGTIALNGATLNLSFASGFTPTVGQQFAIIKNSGGNAIVGTFSQGSSLTVNGYLFGISYVNGVVLNALGKTTTAVTSSVPNVAAYGQSVTFTATLTATAPAAGVIGGTVTFRDGSTVLGTASVSQGVASLTTSALGVGTHNITASFSGTSGWLASSGSLSQVVKPTTTTALASSQTGSVLYQSVMFTATVTPTPSGGVPKGTVTFMDGTTVLGSSTLNGVSGNDQASFTTSALATGNHSITAVYGADSTYLASGSGVVNQSVAATPQLQNGILALPGTAAAATITLTPTLPSGASAYSIGVSYKVGGTTTNYGIFSASNIAIYGGPGTDAVILGGTTGGDSFTIGNGTITENASQTTLFTVTLSGAASTTISGGGGADTLSGPNQASTYTISGANAGTVGGVGFSGIGSLTGGTANDIFKFSAGASLSGSIDGGGGTNTIDDSAVTVNVNANFSTNSISGVGGTFANIKVINAGTGNNALTGPAANSTILITAPNAGSITGIVTFTNFASILGGAGDDTFKFSNGATVSGTIFGGSGNNTIDESLVTSPVTVNIPASTISGVGTTFGKITSFIGGTGTNTINGPAGSTTYNVNAANAVSIGTTSFAKFGVIVAGAGNDVFKFSAGASLSGTIDGGAGTNTIDESAFTTNINANLTTSTISGIVGTFANILVINGGTGVNALTGPAANSTFNINGANSGAIAGSVSFTKFANLIGGVGNDTFKFGNAGSVSGTIYGGNGANTIDDSAVTTSLAANLAASTLTGVGTTFGKIQTIIGGTAVNTINGPAAASTFNVNGANAVNVGGIAFTRFGTLIGGAANDTFKFSAGGTLSGTIDGGGGINTIDDSALTTNVNANLGTNTISGLSGTFANIGTIIGGTGTNALNGPATDTIFNITAPNAGSIAGGITFSKFGSLIGGVGNDTFKFAPGGSVSGTIYGGNGSNTIDDSSLTANIAANLATSTLTGVGTTFGKIQTLIGGTGSNTLTGPATGSTFNINAANAGSVAGLAFSNFGSLAGGAGNDTFVFGTAGTLSGKLDGGAGLDEIDDSAFTTAVTINLANGTATAVGSTVSNIENARGGSGNDTITGSSAGGILIGGGGNDTITGGSGRSILIGGTGSDAVTGGSNDDIVIGGSTSFDGNIAALDAVLAEWQSSDSYATRVSLIKNGGGLNGSTTLIWGTSVTDDGQADTLLGNAGTDWFFEGSNDSSDAQPGEQIN